MGIGKDRFRTFVSVVICGAVVLFGTLLYPLIFLVFASVALIHLLYRRIVSPAEPRRTIRPDAGGAEE